MTAKPTQFRQLVDQINKPKRAKAKKLHPDIEYELSLQRKLPRVRKNMAKLAKRLYATADDSGELLAKSHKSTKKAVSRTEKRVKRFYATHYRGGKPVD